ncbi:MAG: hypothetical protein K6B28_08230 [Lachnospiraceae bacterium]|nr:hypothetical protein [Lachnospiraceae bacterium]
MSIIIATSKLKVYEGYSSLCEYAGMTTEFSDELWADMNLDRELYEEFVYYLGNHTFKDDMKIRGYSLSDLYVFMMDKYNLIREIGKNPTSCNKETMVLNAFKTMVEMKKDPDTYVKRIESGRGNDIKFDI